MTDGKMDGICTFDFSNSNEINFVHPSPASLELCSTDETKQKRFSFGRKEKDEISFLVRSLVSVGVFNVICLSAFVD